MKKTILITIGLWLMGGLALASGFRIEVKGSFFSSENSIFRDVYGSTANCQELLALGRAGLSAKKWWVDGIERRNAGVDHAADSGGTL
jgi:hypothetical protein